MKVGPDFNFRHGVWSSSGARDMRTRMERLSSGLRINRAADDPSGLAISRGMKGQIRGYDVCGKNIQDGISELEVMDGAMGRVNEVLVGMRDLSVRAANEAPLTDADRGRLNDEMKAMAAEIDNIQEMTTFNGKHVFTGVAELSFEYMAMYKSGNDMYTSKVDGTELVKISDFPSLRPGMMEWSRDGEKVAGVLNLGSGYQLYVFDADDIAELADPATEFTLLSNASNVPYCPTWSPDGSKIAYIEQDLFHNQIHVVNSDGTGHMQITSEPGAIGTSFCWSPDGQIIFSRYVSGSSDIYSINPDGTNERNLTQSPGTQDSDPVLSPDGSKIAFFRRIGFSALDIYTMNIDGSNLTNISNSPGNESYINWTPDGSKIVYQADPAGIFMMDADGSNKTVITNHPKGDTMPFLSPDGTSIVFRSYRDNNWRDIYSINVDGTGVTRLTTTNGAFVSSEFPQKWGFPANPEITQVLQVRPDNSPLNRIEITFPYVTAQRLGVDTLNISSVGGAQFAVTAIDRAIAKVSEARAQVGETHMVLRAIDDDNNLHSINIAAANSKIEDADMASEIAALSKLQIHEQSTTTFAVDAERTLRSAALNLLARQGDLMG